MPRTTLHVAWYRLRATFRRNWGGYLAIVLLVGLMGGVAMGAVAGARRTESSFSRFLADTNPSDLSLPTGVVKPDSGSDSGYDPTLIDTIAHLPHVRSVQSTVGLDVLPLGPDGAPLAGIAPQAGLGQGSVDGLGFDQDRLTVTQGRLADPQRTDEFVLAGVTAERLGLHVDDVVHFGIYTNAQTLLDGFGTATVPPDREFDATLVGYGAVSASQVVQDDVDGSSTGGSTDGMFFSPAFTRSLLSCCANYTQTALQLDGGSRDEAAVAAEIQQILPPGFPFFASFTSLAQAKAERAITPEAIALGVFGAIATLATMVIAGQAIGRQLRVGAGDLRVLRAVGASPTTTSSDGLIGVVGAVIIGAVLAAAVAVGLSPLAPIGPVRHFDPSRGLDVDWTVLGLGVVVLTVVLGAVSVGLAHRRAPHREARRGEGSTQKGSSAARAVAASGLPVAAAAGVRLALEPGSGRNTVPARSAIGGAVLAVIVLTATVTFGSSLHTLVSHPPLYGWAWDYELDAGTGIGVIPEEQATPLLDNDPNVGAWSGAYFGAMQIDGRTVPALGMSPGAPVGPPVLSGHRLDSPDEIVLGEHTLALLHKRVGDSVALSYGTMPPTPLRIVGTATLPAIGVSGIPHLEMGDGAILASSLIPVEASNPFDDPFPGPNAIFVRIKDGVDPSAARASLQAIADATSNAANFGVTVEAVQRPAEIVNYRTMGTTPALLGVALAVGAVIALELTLVTSVRRRRRDLALLKTLGFTRRQLLAVVAWQASVAAVIGAVVGVPLGVALGRWLWVLFADQIHAVAQPTVPVPTVILIAIGALVLANVVAAIPGRIAANTPTALLLRSE